DIPGEEELLKIRGEVRWRVLPSDLERAYQPPEELQCGMGIAFVFGSPEERERFETQVMVMLEQELGPEVAQRLMERG
ncbi:MAG: hypothetical protein AAFX99_29085, partial [Myxococcota bacterium]